MKKQQIEKIHSAQSLTKRFGIGMLTPTLVVLLIMTAYPLVFTLVYSFTDYNLLRALKNPATFSALKNYTDLLKDEYFQQAIWNTVKFTILAVIFEMLIGFLMALLVNSLRRGQKAMRTLLLLPFLLPTVTVAMSWRMMLSPNYGIVNQVLTALNLPVYNWFSDVKTAFGMLVVIDVWQSAPFVFLLLYAALQSVPASQYEAARIDGAGDFRIVTSIIAPIVKPALATVAILAFQASWNNAEISTYYVNNDMMRTFAFYLSSMIVGMGNNVAGRGILAAATLVMFIPNLLIFIFMQNKVLNTMAHSGIK